MLSLKWEFGTGQGRRPAFSLWIHAWLSCYMRDKSPQMHGQKPRPAHPLLTITECPECHTNQVSRQVTTAMAAWPCLET
eukprot:366172-Chlamydomonas_euryale.AAC.7